MTVGDVREARRGDESGDGQLAENGLDEVSNSHFIFIPSPILALISSRTLF